MIREHDCLSVLYVATDHLAYGWMVSWIKELLVGALHSTIAH